MEMYLWVPQTVSAAGRNIDCDLAGSIPTQPTQVGCCRPPVVYITLEMRDWFKTNDFNHVSFVLNNKVKQISEIITVVLSCSVVVCFSVCASPCNE